jgi:hypothetical protein
MKRAEDVHYIAELEHAANSQLKACSSDCT